MKHKKDIILGGVVGVIAFLVMIVVVPMLETREMKAAAAGTNPHSNSGFMTQLLSEAPLTGPALEGVNMHGRLDFDDVFASTVYQNMYLMMFQFLSVDPEEDAIEEVAQQYGLTLSEASEARNGALDPILKILPGSLRDYNQQQLLAMADEFVKEFNEIYELYSLQQELTTSVTASELFSNGDVLDSGFDLVHDLSEIEILIFGQVVPNTIGASDEDDKAEKYAEDVYYSEEAGKTPSMEQAYYALELEEPEDEVEDEGFDEPGDEEDEVVFKEFDPADLVVYAEEDVCPEDEENLLKTAIDDYEKEAMEYFESLGQPLGVEPSEEEDEDDVVAGAAPGEEEEEAIEEEKLEPEKADNWTEEMYCDGTLFLGGGGAQGSAEATTTDDDGEEYSLAKAEFYICLETSSKWETYKSFVPAAPCITCEIEKSLAYMQKTLSHSLAPNKLTGNLFESSKCKNVWDAVNSIDLQFISVWAPVPTPPQDDAIYGKSLAKEWEKFVTRNHPYLLETAGEAIGFSLLPEHTTQMSVDWAMQNADPEADLADLITEMGLIEQSIKAKASEDVEKYVVSSQAEDFVIYSQAVMQEVGQMTVYFQKFFEQFQQIVTDKEYCPKIMSAKQK